MTDERSKDRFGVPVHPHDEILRVEVGSTLHGTGRAGQEDTDYMGVCIEPIESVMGLQRFDQWQWRTQPEGERSGHGDIDITVYGLKKYIRLATSGNPSIIVMLFAPPEKVHICDELGASLLHLAPKIVSRKAIDRFIGYSRSQRQRLEGVRGGRHTNRPELISEHGYDTKYAMHALRLIFQGIDLFRTGQITLPMEGDWRAMLVGIRHGVVPYEDFVKIIDEALAELQRLEAFGETPLSENPDYEALEQFMFDARMHSWGIGERCSCCTDPSH